MGQFLLCAGTPGKRFALPHSRILMHQPSGSMQGQAADIAIQAEQIVYLKRMMAERIAFHTGQPIERIEADSDRDRWFTAEEAQGLRLHRPGHRPFVAAAEASRRGLGRPGAPDGSGRAATAAHEGYGLHDRSRTPRRWRPRRRGSARRGPRRKITRVVSPTISVRQRLPRSGSPASCSSTWCAPRSRSSTRTRSSG